VLHLPGAAIGDPGLAGIEDSDPVGRDRDTVPAAPLSMDSPLVTHRSASGRLLRRASSPFALPAACPELRTRLPMPEARLGRHLFAGFRAAASLSALPRDFVFLVFLTFRPVCSAHLWANSTTSTGEARGVGEGERSPGENSRPFAAPRRFSTLQPEAFAVCCFISALSLPRYRFTSCPRLQIDDLTHIESNISIETPGGVVQKRKPGESPLCASFAPELATAGSGRNTRRGTI
jgi:hypothetical protein